MSVNQIAIVTVPPVLCLLTIVALAVTAKAKPRTRHKLLAT